MSSEPKEMRQAVSDMRDELATLMQQCDPSNVEQVMRCSDRVDAMARIVDRCVEAKK